MKHHQPLSEMLYTQQRILHVIENVGSSLIISNPKYPEIMSIFIYIILLDAVIGYPAELVSTPARTVRG